MNNKINSMEDNLKETLRNFDDVDFKETQHCLHIAHLVRDTMRTFQVSFEFMEEKLGMTKKEFFDFWCGSYPYDLRTISKLESLIDDLKAEEFKTELIKFGKYKYNQPNTEQNAQANKTNDL